jgi:outer membrane protein
MSNYCKCRLIPALIIAAGAARAGNQACPGPDDDCAVIGKWNISVALGAGQITNPLYGSKNIPLVLIPHVSYYGKRFFLDDLDIGWSVFDGATNTFSLVATPGYDRVYFYRTDPQNFFVTGLTSAGTPEYAQVPANLAIQANGPSAAKISAHPRHFTYLAGPEWTFKYGTVSGQVDLLREITDQNNGDEVRAGLGIPLLRGKGTLSANFGLTWKSASIVNYYYGEPGIYEGGSSLDPFAKLAYTIPLSSKWRFDAFYQYERLGNAIANSPIVAEHSVATMFVGAIYTF